MKRVILIGLIALTAAMVVAAPSQDGLTTYGRVTYKTAYEATGDEKYLARARSIANTFTVVQREWNGEYPTFFTKYPMNLWLNSVVYPAKVLMELQGVQ